MFYQWWLCSPVFKPKLAERVAAPWGAPRAVVLQGHLKNGQYDYIGWQKALAFASQQLGHNIAVVVAHPDRLQSSDRIYMCIEYKDFDAFNIATAQFRALLAPHPSVEIVQNSSCPRS